MAMQPAICRNCGGSISVDDVDLNGFSSCPFCGTSHKVIDVITIDGLPTAKSLLINAAHAMQFDDTDTAMNLYGQVLQIKPNCHEAWWGLYLCQDKVDAHYGYRDKYGNAGCQVKARIMQEALSRFAYPAIQYAPANVAQLFRQQIAAAEQYIQGVNQGLITDKKAGLLSGLRSKLGI